MGTGNGFLSIDEPTAAIDFEGGGSNIIKGNNLANNYNAMSFLETENNTITKNNITNTLNPSIGDGTGIAFWGASNNTIYHNNFINNTVQAYDNSFNSPFSVNVWDNGYPSGGNYWSDYQTRYPNAKMRDSSGIGNASYIIDQNNTDHYPLLQLFNITSITECHSISCSNRSRGFNNSNSTLVSLYALYCCGVQTSKDQ